MHRAYLPPPLRLLLLVRATLCFCPFGGRVGWVGEPENATIDVRTNRDMTFWLDDRLKKRKDVDEMGLSEDWLRYGVP